MNQLVFSIAVLFTYSGFVIQASAGPVPNAQHSGNYSIHRADDRLPLTEFDPANMRVIVVGDSQVATMPATRIRVHMRSWDMPIAGAFIGADFIWSGQEVLFDTTTINGITGSAVSNPSSWYGGGPADFGTYRGYQWVCSQDVDAPDTAFGSYKHYLEFPNTTPASNDWITGKDVLVRVAVRTNPGTVPFVETRATRGLETDQNTRTIHELNQTHGYQILEQIVPADFEFGVDGTGVSFFLPDKVQEFTGNNFQVLGVSLLVLGNNGNPIPGQIVGANAYPGWRASNHLALSQSSRMALIELVDANSILIMLGHNREDFSGPGFGSNYNDLVDLWYSAFESLGKRSPALISVVPWMIDRAWAQDYLADVSSVMSARCERDRGIFLSYLEYFDFQVPDDFDPELYVLDSIRTHPGDDPTAQNLSLDMEIMLNQRLIESLQLSKSESFDVKQSGTPEPSP